MIGDSLGGFAIVAKESMIAATYDVVLVQTAQATVEALNPDSKEPPTNREEAQAHLDEMRNVVTKLQKVTELWLRNHDRQQAWLHGAADVAQAG